jgi:CheY-like chemotaxis protein
VEHEAASAAAPAERETRPREGLRILVAEDHRDTADSLSMLLERHGHVVRVARDGRAAVRSFADFQPDVALIDIGLPMLDGYQVARELRKEETGRRAILVALSGYGRAEDKSAAKDAGFDHHMTKPVDIRALTRLFPQT